MSTSSRQSLQSLLPASYAIPPKLLSTTDLLVTLSLQRAPNLKPDEEIARTHACADLACQRLRVSLRLPNLKSSTAPCRPAVYKKLLVFLTEKLADVDVSGTPKRKREPRAPQSQRTQSQIQSQRPSRQIPQSQSQIFQSARSRLGGQLDGEADEVIEDATPTKRRRTEPQALLNTPTPRRKNTFLGKVLAATEIESTTKSELKFILPSVRKLCKRFEVPELIPYTYIGVGVLSKHIWSEMKRSVDAELLQLTIATFLLVLTKMKRGPMTDDLLSEVGSGACEVLGTGDVRGEVDAFIARISSEEMIMEGEGKEGKDWWDDVPEEALGFGEEEYVEGSEETMDRGSLAEKLAKKDPEGVLIVGLGTMMCEGVDLLGEEKIEELVRWKRGMIGEIEALG